MSRRPDVIIVLADDLGYSDIAPFGGEIDTPALDRLAARGVRMSSFYVTPRCSPSRASLLTGRAPHETGIGVLTGDDRPNGYPGSLSVDVPTLAEHLGQQGYVSGLFGKWHLSHEIRTPAPTWPTRRGFAEFHGILHGASSFYQPPLVDQEERVDPRSLSDDYYFTDDITEHGVDFVRRHAGGDTPYFLLLTYTAPHWPLHAPDREAIAKYRERFRDGHDVVRQRRLRRLRESELVPGVERLPDSTLIGDEDQENREWQVERMAVYAAQVESMDAGIGRVLDALEEAGTIDDTILLFLSDNGGCAEELPVGVVERMFNPAVAPRTTRSGESVVLGSDPAVMPGPESSFQSYGKDWATVSNTPFRLWKRWVHEGGISTPFIASWPAGGVATGGAITHTPGHVIDVVPTILSAVGGSKPLEGADLLPFWRDTTATEPERALFWEHVGNAAVRRGRFKLVREWGWDWELYDIVADRTETRDLASENPDMVAELAELWQNWADSHGVIPWADVLADYDRRNVRHNYVPRVR